MAIQPFDLSDRVLERAKEVVDRLEPKIDAAIQKDYDGNATTGRFTFNNGKEVISHAVLMELRRRYHGWKVEYLSGSDARDGESWSYLEFMPKTIRGE